MDRQLILAQISRYLYKMIFKPRLFRFDRFKEFSRIFIKYRDRLVMPDDVSICLPNNKIIIDKAIARQGDIALPSEVTDHFIEKSGYRAVMNYCICRRSNGCQDYPIDSGCLFLGETARRIHPDMHRPVSKEEAKAYVQSCREKGLVQLVGRANLDALWLGIGPHDKLFTICNCCPCCCISLAAPYMAPELSDWLIKMPGIKVTVSEDCSGCQTCRNACIYGGLEFMNGKAAITDHCRACGRCVAVCPQKAIQISISEESVQATIDLLEQRVDVT